MPGKRKGDSLSGTRNVGKDDFINLHVALFRLRHDLQERNHIPSTAFEAYDKLGILPTHISRARGAHQAAVLALIEGFRGLKKDPRYDDLRRL